MSKTTNPREIVFRIQVEDDADIVLPVPERQATAIFEAALKRGVTPETVLCEIFEKAANNPKNPYNLLIGDAIARLGHAHPDQIKGRMFPIEKPRKPRRDINNFYGLLSFAFCITLLLSSLYDYWQ